METQIGLPPDLTAKLEREAAARGMSLGELVRQSLEWAMAQKRADDPLFADDSVYREQAPSDLATNHDDYLYGDAP